MLVCVELNGAGALVACKTSVVLPRGRGSWVSHQDPVKADLNQVLNLFFKGICYFLILSSVKLPLVKTAASK